MNSLWRLIQVMADGGFSAVCFFIYTAALDRDALGTYGTLTTVAFLFQLLVGFGLRESTSRFVAVSRGEKQESRIRAYVGAGFKLSLAFAAITALALAGAAPFLSSEYLPGWADSIPIMISLGWLIVAYGLKQYFDGVLEGGGYFREVMLVNFGMGLFQLVLVASLLGAGLSLLLVIAAEALATTAALGVMGYTAWRRLYQPFAPASGFDPARQLLRYGSLIFVSAVAQFLYSRVDMLFVRGWLTAEDAADYYFMVKFFDFPLRALAAYVFVLNTEVAVTLGEANFDRVMRLFYKSEAAGLGIGAILAVVFFVTSYLLPIFFPEYGNAMRLMRLVAPLIAVKSVALIASGAFMVSLGRVRAMAFFTVMGAVVNVSLDALLIPGFGSEGAVYDWPLLGVVVPAFGVDGAVYSTLVGHTLYGLLVVAYVWRTLRRGAAARAAQPKA